MFKWWPEEETNRGLQVIAVLMALTLWIFVGLLPRMDLVKRHMTVAIKIHGASGSPVRLLPDTADVLIEGPKRVMSRMTDQDFEVFVDLDAVDLRDSRTIPLNVSGPPGVHWEISPTDVQVLVP